VLAAERAIERTESDHHMARVYLDPSAVFVRLDEGRPPALAPDAPAAIQDLVDTGHEAILISEGIPTSPGAIPEALGSLAIAGGPEPDVNAWMITGDRRRCRQRRPWLRTVLVGGGPAPENDRWRCDAEAADLRSAVLHIVSREAMP
jgi:hypothetical protein